MCTKAHQSRLITTLKMSLKQKKLHRRNIASKYQKRASSRCLFCTLISRCLYLTSAPPHSANPASRPLHICMKFTTSATSTTWFFIRSVWKYERPNCSSGKKIRWLRVFKVWCLRTGFDLQLHHAGPHLLRWRSNAAKFLDVSLLRISRISSSVGISKNMFNKALKSWISSLSTFTFVSRSPFCLP